MIDGIAVEVKRSKRKTISLQIDRNGNTILRIPSLISDAQAHEILEKRKCWIEHSLSKIQTSIKETDSLPCYTSEQLSAFAQKAKDIIPERVAQYASIIGVTYGKITIRCQKTRWGSCSSCGNLNFNCLLVDMPREVLDSVIVHELCHRREMNHSTRFYAEIHRVFPEYDRWDKWLKDNGNRFLRRVSR